ncbi:hypothetical protein ACSF6V_20310 [Escherichia coli]|uniref:hypothetical protein n=1 Tax=Escherichia coli TaxID=562 RepID=UPI003EEA6A44
MKITLNHCQVDVVAVLHFPEGSKVLQLMAMVNLPRHLSSAEMQGTFETSRP